MKTLWIALTVLTAAGCATFDRGSPDYWRHINRTTSAKSADTDACRLEAARAGGYDWLDASMRRSEVFALCMKSRGYYHSAAN
jgi:hypothetical protein